MDTPTPSSTSSNTNLLTNSKITRIQLQHHSVPIDISNDSPIVGLESKSLKTPRSRLSTMRNGNLHLEVKTPGSGESILRGQVRTLLKKKREEEEEAGIIIKNPFGSQYSCHDSPVQEDDKVSQKMMMNEEKKEDDYPSTEDDNSSVWSIQVNASSKDEKDEEEDYEENEMGKLEEADELCKVIKKKMNIVGKHTRFVYDSDDELVKEEEVEKNEGILKLNGLPTPQGKHLFFPQILGEEEDG